ncbi:MAG: site-2 protease family protein [Thermodesulfobacteriota bacterium]
MDGHHIEHRAVSSNRPAGLVPALLFAITLGTTVIAGALYQGADLLHHPRELLLGLPFSISLLLILGTHELGHFIASRRHGITTTWPLFIPAPPIPPMIGTFGALIKIKSPITTRNALVDIGASGPLAGFVVAVIVTAIGLRASTIIAVPEGAGALGFGSSLIFHGLTYIVLGPVPDGMDVFLSPVAFAGWIGFFVTAMNLLPLGQLDGGHVIYALLGESQRPISLMLVAVMAVLGYFAWPGWFIWAALITIIGLRHPPLMDQSLPMDSRRKLTTMAATLVFVLTFMPTPFYIV